VPGEGGICLVPLDSQIGHLLLGIEPEDRCKEQFHVVLAFRRPADCLDCLLGGGEGGKCGLLDPAGTGGGVPDRPPGHRQTQDGVSSAASNYAAWACSSAWPRRTSVASSKWRPRICMPMGRPSRDWPQGTEMPGTPARSAVTV